MSFYSRLQEQTAGGRDYVTSAPLVQRAINGSITLDEYVAYLCQAYHHVRHTTPLLMATGARLAADKEWLREAVADYIEEEIGHQEWVLNDLAACGFSRDKARTSMPNFSTELMVSFAYDSINRISPLCFFGMVQVLEGTSIRLAERAADSIQSALHLPNHAFSYLRSHGALDQDHIKFFETLMNRIEDPREQQLILHSANRFFRLYGDVFREVRAEQAELVAA